MGSALHLAQADPTMINHLSSTVVCLYLYQLVPGFQAPKTTRSILETY